jgi:hypothetical protein
MSQPEMGNEPSSVIKFSSALALLSPRKPRLRLKHQDQTSRPKAVSEAYTMRPFVPKSELSTCRYRFMNELGIEHKFSHEGLRVVDLDPATRA